MGAHNIVRLCQKFPEKYPAPSAFYFGEIECIFSPFKGAEIDLAVLAVKGEIEKEDFDKKQKERQQQNSQQTSQYQSPLVRRPDDEDDW